jgi:hypothetical protein
MMFYYNNGLVQKNVQRFSLDFFSILILLIALGVKQEKGRLWKVAIVYSVFLNFLALFTIPAARITWHYVISIF